MHPVSAPHPVQRTGCQHTRGIRKVGGQGDTSKDMSNAC